MVTDSEIVPRRVVSRRASRQASQASVLAEVVAPSGSGVVVVVFLRTRQGEIERNSLCVVVAFWIDRDQRKVDPRESGDPKRTSLPQLLLLLDAGCWSSMAGVRVCLLSSGGLGHGHSHNYPTIHQAGVQRAPCQGNPEVH